jgi:hypothetical protein
MLAIWKFSCNSFFKVSSNSSTYLSFPFVKLRIKEFKYFLDTKHIQLLKVALNELHSLLMDRKDYPIGAYIHACSTTTNTQIEKFNKFIGYLAFSPVSTVRGRTFTVPPLNLPKFLTLISNMFITPASY